MNREIENFIKKQAQEAMKLIEIHGYIPGGGNGPYQDNETPVRVSAHWIQIFSWLYSKEGSEQYLDAIEKLASYLYNQKVEKTNYSFCCRNKEGKDKVNGTIGQAWIIEGLIEASKVLNDNKYYDLAVKVFLNHKFNDKIGCWNRYEIDGRILGYDGTFNHQLWLAAAGAQIVNYKDNEEIRKQIKCFLDNCINNFLFHIHPNGTICHYCCIRDSAYHILYYYLRELKQKFNEILKKPNMRYKEEGYHYFALYGFAILKEEFKDHSIFKHKKMIKAVNYAVNPNNYKKQLNVDPQKDGTKLANKIGGKYNIYCFPYNSPFYELPYICKIFAPDKLNDELIDELWEIQKNSCLDEYGNMTQNNKDSITLTARIYELLRGLR